jgi:hypothetical protein
MGIGVAFSFRRYESTRQHLEKHRGRSHIPHNG